MRGRGFTMVWRLVLGLLAVAGLNAQGLGPNPGSLKRVPVPQPTNLPKYVKDRTALVTLGKTLFWDMQTGSDGRQACASCHFHAGADHRAQNQLSKTSGALPVNHLLTLDEFPFHVLANAADNRSAVLRDTPAVAGSGGLFRRIFVDLVPGSAPDNGFDAGDIPAFSHDSVNVPPEGTRNSSLGINVNVNF